MADEIVPAPAPTPAPQASWFDGFDTETKGYITNRGLDKKDINTAFLETAKAHREAQAHIGVPPDQILKLPKDTADAAGWNAVHERLGRPKDAAGYDFAGVENLDDATKEKVRAQAFKLNLSKDAANALARDVIADKSTTQTQTDTEKAAAFQRQIGELKKDWGFNFDANRLTAKAAADKIGLSAEEVDAIEGASNFKTVMTALHKIGVSMGEDKFVTSEHTGRVMSRDGAVERISALKKDTAWVTKYLAGDAASKKEMDDLHLLAFGRAS